jgi:hypothetical protein
LSATASDQFGQPMVAQPTFTWALSGAGLLDSSQLYTAPQNDGLPQAAVVTASVGDVAGTAEIEISGGWSYYKFTLGGSHVAAGSSGFSGALTQYNSDWIAAAPVGDAIAQAIQGSVVFYSVAQQSDV